MVRSLPAENPEHGGPSHAEGAALALLTAMLWGALPLALKQIAHIMTPAPVGWYRFCTAAAWLWICRIRAARGAVHGGGSGTDRRLPWLMLVLAALGLGGNFVLYNASAVYLSAPATQIVAQLGPMLLMLGGVLVLGEPFLTIQALGVPILLFGFGLFFNRGLLDLGGCDLGFGLFLGVSATVVWAAYGVIQKKLLVRMRSVDILRWLYTFCAIGFTPFASPAQAFGLDWAQALCLAFCCMNTVAAYGAFGRAMSLWHTAKVSGLITLSPLFALAFAWLAHWLSPFFPPQPVNMLNFSGALLVVSGACLIAAGPMLRLPWRPAKVVRGR